MASRLNEDDAQGQNKWADIDDDDDDWAPEAITWGDGTKTTLPHPDEQPQPPPVQHTSPAPVDLLVQDISKSEVGSSIAVGSPNPRPSGFAAGKGLVLKPSSQEKPVVAAKPQGTSTTAKSPWAALPPVDRASPGLPEPTQSQIQFGHSRDFAGPKGPGYQMRPIAADDFSRSSWRENMPHGSRELYNSHSGRYEPVPDRRGSMRQDGPAKYPALLQRPQASDTGADQHTTGQLNRPQQDGAFGRRRASSSVSGGSGPLHQRTANLSGQSSQGPRKFSLSGSTEGVGPLEDGVAAPTINHSIAPGEQNIPSDQTAASQQATGDAVLDEVEYQKKLMRERIDLAKKRRQEEEAKEEAARKERIQKKLEALGPPPEKKSDKKESQPQAETAKRPQIQQRERRDAEDMLRKSTAGRSTTDSVTAGTSTKALSPKAAPAQATSSTSRRMSHGSEARRGDLWGGTGPRPERFVSWAAGASSQQRSVWGSPDNDRGLGNGTFNPDLSRVPSNPSTATAPATTPLPIGPPGSGSKAQTHHGQSPKETSSAQVPRYTGPSTDLASKWVTSVAENDKKLSAASSRERAELERQLQEHGITLDDAQPAIKDSWRPIQVPGDGNRHTMGQVEVKSHQSGPWKRLNEGSSKPTGQTGGGATLATAGVIGSVAPSQVRASRFFPTKDGRPGPNSVLGQSRSSSPTPPPPTMEDHPAYEGDAMRPHVSFPKPQPVVKLPPAVLAAQQSRMQGHHGTWTSTATLDRTQHAGLDSTRRSETSQGKWQDRINNLLHTGKPLSGSVMKVDASSRGPMDHVGHVTAATVSLPGSVPRQNSFAVRPLVTKPMAEECFEEQEMGSLPQIRLPHRVPDAAWQPANVEVRPLPRRFLVHAAIMEPFQIPSDSANGTAVMQILLPGMTEAKTMPLPSSTRRLSRGSHSVRASPRQRGPGASSRGGKRDPSNIFKSETTHGSSHRASRGGLRGRGAESWNRQPSGASQPPKSKS